MGKLNPLDPKHRKQFEIAQGRDEFSEEENENLWEMVDLYEDESIPRPRLVNLDKALAEEFLKHNGKNRNLSGAAVDAYQVAMEDGRWGFSESAICFDSKGRMINGQHRCAAVLKARDPEISIPMIVIGGLSPSAQMFMDQGKDRTAAEALQISGAVTKNAGFVAAAVKKIIPWEVKGIATSGRQMQQQSRNNVAVHEWVVNHPEDVEFLLENYDLVKRNPYNPVSPALGGAILHAFSRKDRDVAKMFFSVLASGGAGAPLDHPAAVLAKRLAKYKNKEDGYTQLSELMTWGMYVTAWNAMCDLKIIKMFRPPVGGWTSSNLPEIENPAEKGIPADPNIAPYKSEW